MKKTIDEEERADEAMKQTIDQLEKKFNGLQEVARKEPNIMFTAVLTSHKSLRQNTIVDYDRIITNVGGAYNERTGIFSCPVAGYYHFEVHAQAAYQNDYWLQLTVNEKKIFTLGAASSVKAYRGTSNSGIVKLSSGDQVKVSSWSTNAAKLWATPDWLDNSFSGRLVALE